MQMVVLGAGSWGTAFAVHLERLGHGVSLVPRRIEQALDIATKRENTLHLAGVFLPHNLQIIGHLKPALMEADVAILACPIKGLEAAVKNLNESLADATQLKGLIVLCKGLNPHTLEHPFTYIKKTLVKSLPVVVLSGPNHALSVAQGLPSAAVIGHAPKDQVWAKELQHAFSNEQFRIYTRADKIGVSLGGALKNIYAIGAGICEGLQLGDNAKAAFLTRAVKEMTHLGIHLGGERDTFFGLSGLGDLMATAYGPWSRNHTFGLKLGQGHSIQTLLTGNHSVVEGYMATEAFYQKLSAYIAQFPILSALWEILYQNKPIKQTVAPLMQRPLGSEF